MKRGRKPKPENIKRDTLPTSIVGEVVAPKHLTEVEVAIFNRIVQTMAEMNTLTIGDVDIVASYAAVVAMEHKHKALLDANGAIATTATGYKYNAPEYAIWRDSMKTGLAILNDLGLTPAARTRVAAVAKEEVDEFAEFLNKRKNAKQANG